MKKVLLGLLAVSAISFGASNSGDNNLEKTTGVPVEVRANVIPKGARLVLVDGNDNIIDKLVFDHKNIIQGQTHAMTQMVKVRRTDNGALFASGSKDGTVTFSAIPTINGKTATANDNNFPLYKDLGGKEEELSSTLDFNNKPINIDETGTKAQTMVTSTVIAKADQEEGLYIGTGTFTATLGEKGATK
ncbi:hypothetical protein SAMN02745174_01869 [Cetobacterium ceti]|uniref:WxL domain-containing protein n=1 Tax=Cetobacterium ceti TaxID=180163 RepID=A0A1T4PFN2_9FUSO|nr:hypothetical protein [Cetobacterium ceti]SJZ89618.1 hypothetical protein SAMN02745174_01869 [Cetobacterium ceti]